jgi:hypothetical protein
VAQRARDREGLPADASAVARRRESNGLEAWAQVMASGYKGMVAKDEASVYEGGTTRRWLKVKQKDWTVAEDGWRRRISAFSFCRRVAVDDPGTRRQAMRKTAPLFVIALLVLAAAAEACSGWVLWRYTLPVRGSSHASVRLAFETKNECEAAAPVEARDYASFVRSRPKISKVEYKPPATVWITRDGESEAEDVEFRCMPDGVDLRAPRN